MTPLSHQQHIVNNGGTILQLTTRLETGGAG
jgi:hypothetical protein